MTDRALLSPALSPMQRALALAEQALWLTSPNPRVGCVITGAEGQVLGEGHTQRAGGPHAEVMALRDAQARGHSLQGACAWVTLEPCAHHGRTGPCCDALAAAGIARVVVATGDPNPRVAGQGLARLQAAGVHVQCLPASDPLAQQARELNVGFFSRMERARPWVRMKIAASIDGQTALANGQSQWITSAEARADATPGAPVPARCSRASARCSRTIRCSLCVASTPRASHTWWWSTAGWSCR